VRFAGDAVALIVAESAVAAQDARELVAVEYRDLPAVVSAPMRWRRALRWCTTRCRATSCSTTNPATKPARARRSSARRA
jgi:xanthine dehydrogenase molybdopterin-binding subunit B